MPVVEGKADFPVAHSDQNLALRCGGQFLGKDMTAFTNQYGNIDIGRAGCSTAGFLANFDEISEALNTPAPPKMTFNYWEVFWREALPLLMLAPIAFLGVNILGFAYLGARLIVRWVWAGFRSAPAADRSRDDHARDRGHRK
jgi:hypothetical protein